jgi:CHAT domain-containing protein
MEAKREQLVVEIGRHSPEFRARAMPVTIESVQQAIPAEAALVEFATYRPFNAKAPNDPDEYGASRYIAYVLRHEGGIQFTDLGEAAAIDASVVALRQALRSPLRRDVKSLSRATDARVLEPVRRLVGDATRLLISPDGELNLIPFEALRDERGRFAIERFSISYLTSGRDLLRLQLPRASKSAPLIVADPTFGPAPRTQAVYFTPLPGTALEARSIKAVFPDATVLRGTKATKSALAHAEAPALLHIATHGFFLRNSTQIENPLLRSGLALSRANARSQGHEEGVLTALEASTLNLWGTRLVTLSGCDTGVGDIKNGEGVYGLRRAFLLAGAETLVMSLWSVSDLATREMMTSYYRGLKQGLGRGEALRQAQLAMLKRADRRHPFYWASFIQAGDWSRFDAQP